MGKVPVNRGQKCKIRTEWFKKLDEYGKPFARYLTRVPGSNTRVSCTICNTQLSCEYKGFQAITQHLESVRHKKNMKSRHSQLQLSADYEAVVTNPSVQNDTIEIVKDKQTTSLRITDERDETTKAEIIWTMKNVKSNYSGKSCDDLNLTFQKMFPNEPSCKEFTLAHSKLSYMISECVGPHFRDIFLTDIKNSLAHYTLCFDETTNDASRKELQTSVRYYSERQKQIQEFHLETFFLENGKGETIVKYLFQSLDNEKLPTERLMTLSRDGPNTNKKVFRLMNEEFNKRTGRNLIDVGSCDIHIIHNGFKKGLDEYGKNIADLSINLHYFFYGESLRSEEFRTIETKHGKAHHRFIKHIPTRWLTLLESTLRIIEQQNVTEEYFLKYIPKSRPESSTLKAELYMVKESAELLQLYLKYLQVDRPIIHKLHDLLSQILLKLLGRIATPASLLKTATITTENFGTKNLIPIDDIILSKDIVEALKDCKEVEKSKFRLNYRNHFKEIGLHILRKSCYQNSIVQCVKVIGPSRILDADSSQKIMKLVNSLPFNVPPTFIDEWSLVKATVNSEHLSTYEGRIDDFWVGFFDKVGIDNSKTFASVAKVIQSVLSINHGSGGIERMISNSGLILSEDNYFLYLEGVKSKEAELKKKQVEDEKRRMENISKKDAIAKETNSIKDIENVLKEKEKENSHNASKLLEEANDRLKKAIEKKNLSEISLAQGMIEGAKVLIDAEQKKTGEIFKLKAAIEKGKSAIIDKYIKITPK
ncbi:hypothetical protein Bhyg_08948 [Pseudolycoriella hygida]|uniref:DUF4371 domain-containing protein n=1 Tax=Pseudolycoriella hygida TaxID=35572 RepID=A0A9Q0N5K5_9DIPT|nr:hypothetical protein Bhyg_08948 [Pseudolycoriella hygida]